MGNYFIKSFKIELPLLLIIHVYEISYIMNDAILSFEEVHTVQSIVGGVFLPVLFFLLHRSHFQKIGNFILYLFLLLFYCNWFLRIFSILDFYVFRCRDCFAFYLGNCLLSHLLTLVTNIIYFILIVNIFREIRFNFHFPLFKKFIATYFVQISDLLH